MKKIEDILKEEGVYVSITSGISMYPLLRDRKDTIVVRPCKGRLKKYDVPLYRSGERYILHRILKVNPDHYVIRGDNCVQKEYVADDQILGVLTQIYRNGKLVSTDDFCYRSYAKIWTLIYPLRYLYKRIRSCAGKCFRRLKNAGRA